MKSCLITNSLINSIDWYLTAPSSIIKKEKGGDGSMTWTEKAKTDLQNTVGRIYGPLPKAAQQGIDFEKRVYANANLDNYDDIWSNEFRQICNEVKGFEFYQKAGVQKEIAEEQCYLYGKFDAINDSMIKDIKTTQQYSYGKYLKTFQHKLYCYIKQCSRFEYIIAEWDQYPEIKKVHKEIYEVSTFLDLEIEVFEKVEQCLNELKELGLWDLYREKFCLY